MRRLIPAVALLLAASFAASPAGAGDEAKESKDKKEMTAIVVSTDPSVKTITVRSETDAPDAEPETLTVAGSAVGRLTTIKAGEKVKLVLSMDPATNKESVTSIEKSSSEESPQQ